MSKKDNEKNNVMSTMGMPRFPMNHFDMSSLPELLAGALSGIDTLRKLQEASYKENKEMIQSLARNMQKMQEENRANNNELRAELEAVKNRIDENTRITGKEANAMCEKIRSKVRTIYYFPTMDEKMSMTPEQRKVYSKKYGDVVRKAYRSIKNEGHFAGQGGRDTLAKDREAAELDIVNYKINELEVRKVDEQYEREFKAVSGQ